MSVAELKLIKCIIWKEVRREAVMTYQVCNDSQKERAYCVCFGVRNLQVLGNWKGPRTKAVRLRLLMAKIRVSFLIERNHLRKVATSMAVFKSTRDYCSCQCMWIYNVILENMLWAHTSASASHTSCVQRRLAWDPCNGKKKPRPLCCCRYSLARE